jgi:hypothetical protein
MLMSTDGIDEALRTRISMTPMPSGVERTLEIIEDVEGDGINDSAAEEH